MTEPPNDPRARIPALEERLAADPRSPMFLPLAEAYRAAGRRPDAERVLRDGLLRHPGHHSARAALGRILLESGKIICTVAFGAGLSWGHTLFRW